MLVNIESDLQQPCLVSIILPPFTYCHHSHTATLHILPPFTYCHHSHTATLHILPPFTYCHPSHTATIHILPSFTYCHPSHTATIHILPSFTYFHHSHTATIHILPSFTYCHPSHTATLHILPPFTYCHPSHTATIHILQPFTYCHHSHTAILHILPQICSGQKFVLCLGWTLHVEMQLSCFLFPSTEHYEISCITLPVCRIAITVKGLSNSCCTDVAHSLNPVCKFFFPFICTLKCPNQGVIPILKTGTSLRKLPRFS